MFAQRQKPIDFAAEGLRLALSVDRNCGIRVESLKEKMVLACKVLQNQSVVDVYGHFGAAARRPDPQHAAYAAGQGGATGSDCSRHVG
jgi:hypothetical protein